MFCDRMDVEKLQRVPLSVFRHCETFRKFVFSPKGPPSTATKMLTISEVSPRFSVPGACASGPRRATRSIFFGFSIFEYCKLALGSPFAIFETCIWRRLGLVPACLTLSGSPTRSYHRQFVNSFCTFNQQLLRSDSQMLFKGHCHVLCTHNWFSIQAKNDTFSLQEKFPISNGIVTSICN